MKTHTICFGELMSINAKMALVNRKQNDKNNIFTQIAALVRAIVFITQQYMLAASNASTHACTFGGYVNSIM